MKLIPPKPAFVPTRRVITPGGAIEWQELPSLAGQVAEPFEGRATDPAPLCVWADTEPAGFDDFAVSVPMPLQEPLEGMTVCEVLSPQVFEHFFGTPTGR